MDIKYLADNVLQLDLKDLKLVTDGLLKRKIFSDKKFTINCQKDRTPYVRVTIKINESPPPTPPQTTDANNKTNSTQP